MVSKKTRVLIGLAGLLLASLPASAQYRRYSYDEYGGGDGEFRIHLGSFRPDGSSEYWRSIRSDFTNSDPSDFEDVSFGIDFLLPIQDRMGVIFSGSWYEGTTTNAYRDFLDNFDDRIRHDTTLDIASATVGLYFRLAPRRSPIQPYVAVGGGVYPWRLQERGDFIDLNNPNLPIFRSHLSSSGTAFGYYGLVGLQAPITRRVSIFAEGRWTRVNDDLKDDFEGFGKLDLSGREIAAGLSWRL
jgi:opacity protein-like surface antigen